MKSIFPQEATAEVLNSRRGGFAKVLGVEFCEVGPDYLRARIAINETHLRSGGIMNGGVSLGIIETVGSTAANVAVIAQKLETLGIQVNAHHLRPAFAGDVLTATARFKHLGRKMHVWEVAIENRENKVVCTGTISLLIVEKLP